MPEERFVEKKLEEISRYMDELGPMLAFSYNEFLGDYTRMRTAERDFQLIVDAAVDINNHILLTLGLPPAEKNFDSFILLGKNKVLSMKDAIHLAPSAGLRNKLVHEYDEIDPKILYRSLKTFFIRYKDYGKAVLAFLERQPKS